MSYWKSPNAMKLSSVPSFRLAIMDAAFLPLGDAVDVFPSGFRSPAAANSKESLDAGAVLEPVVGVVGLGVADSGVSAGAVTVAAGGGEGAVQPPRKIAATPRATKCLPIRQMIRASPAWVGFPHRRTSAFHTVASRLALSQARIAYPVQMH